MIPLPESVRGPSREFWNRAIPCFKNMHGYYSTKKNDSRDGCVVAWMNQMMMDRIVFIHYDL
jgi:hypothetical protein